MGSPRVSIIFILIHMWIYYQWIFYLVSLVRVSFENEGFLIQRYFASEKDPHCLITSSTNFPNHQVIHLAEISRITQAVLDSLPKIDFLQCTFPCTDLSAVNATAKGLHGKILIEMINMMTYVIFYFYYRSRRNRTSIF